MTLLDIYTSSLAAVKAAAAVLAGAVLDSCVTQSDTSWGWYTITYAQPRRRTGQWRRGHSWHRRRRQA